VIKNLIKYYLKKILKKDNSNWILGLIRGDINEVNLKKTIFFKPPVNEFWADPFLIIYKKKRYVFFEKFLKKENKGILSVGEIKNNKLMNIRDILNKNYHLSYPFVFKRGNFFYLIPETHENKRLEVYRSNNFPYEWKLYSTAFHGEIVADPTILFYKNKLWLFINKTKKILNKLNKDLYIYQIDNLKFSKMTPHKENPVISSLKRGRNAGNFFTENNKIYRPSQINKTNNYGYGICISEIKKLDINEYVEKKIKTIKPNLFKNLKGMHHLSKKGNYTLIDFNFY
jgi:hypothetical protein